MDYYWSLEQFDGTVTEVPPQAVEVVKKRMANGDPINTRTMVIPANQIKSFRQSDKPFGQPLLEAAAQAFNEPMYAEDGSVKAKWVKKSVSQKAYDKSYSGIPAYRKLDDDNGRVVIAFTLPIHEVDINVVSPCNADEINRLTRR
jgi:hypothetical protein